MSQSGTKYYIMNENEIYVASSLGTNSQSYMAKQFLSYNLKISIKNCKRYAVRVDFSRRKHFHQSYAVKKLFRQDLIINTKGSAKKC